MATIRVVGKSWVLSWVQAGKQHRRAVGKAAVISRREAEMIRKAKEVELATGTRLLGVQVRSTGWSAFCDRYLAWRDVQFPSSKSENRGLINGHLRPHFDHLPLERITSDHLEEYKAQRLEQVRAATVVKELNTMRAMLHRAVKWRLLPSNPGASVPNPQLLDSRPRDFYTAEQLQLLYRAEAHAAYRATWQLMANTGMRRNEALALRWQHVTPTAVRIVSTEASRTKSLRWREVPRSDGANEALDMLPRVDDYVLPRVAPTSLSRAYARTAKDRLPGSIHWLRHTFISHLVMRGVPLRTVQVLAGHSTIAVTEKYAHLAPDYMREVMKGFRL